MKLLLLSLFAIILSNEAFAQRGPRYNPPGGSSNRPTTTTTHHGSSSTTTYHTGNRTYDYNNNYDYDYGYNNPYDYNNNYGRPVIVGPRYNPPHSRRVIRTVRRPQIIWDSGFGYQCNSWGDLSLNGRQVHTFRFNSDCQQAISDIRYYGDFCDMEDLYDQSGYLEAQFTFSSECRSALGWYY